MSIKSLSIIIVLTILSLSTLSAQSFTYNGPTTPVIGFNQTTVGATYYFNYSNLNNLCYPALIIAVDGNVISGDLCNNPTTPSSYTINFTPGAHSVSFKLLSINCQTLNCYNMVIHQEQTFTVNAYFKVRIENIFSGGTIYVDNYSTPKNAPYDRTSYVNFSFPIGAIGQPYGGYNWIWNTSGTNNSYWKKILSNGTESNYSSSQNTTYNVQAGDMNSRLVALLRKVCAVSFQNNFVNLGNGGVIKVNGTQYNSPTSTFNVVELNPIQANGVTQTFNSITYKFDHWNDGSTVEFRTFNPAAHTAYTAYYKGRPSIANRNLHTSTTIGQPITLYWDEHPNTNVTKYQVWRKVKHNGVLGPEVLLATKNRGTLSYRDVEYSLTQGYTDDLIYYDVRPYYSIEGTYSEPSWLAVFGEEFAKPVYPSNTNNNMLENSISNFPNPFNPNTNISYSIKESGLVNIRIYDLLGQQVAEIVNEEKESGSYTALFDASHLPSGIYIYTINAKNFTQTRKMLLMK